MQIRRLNEQGHLPKADECASRLKSISPRPSQLGVPVDDVASACPLPHLHGPLNPSIFRPPMNFKGVGASRQFYFKLPMGGEVVFPEWKPGYLNRLLLVIPEIDMARDRLVASLSEMIHWTVAASGKKIRTLVNMSLSKDSAGSDSSRWRISPLYHA